MKKRLAIPAAVVSAAVLSLDGRVAVSVPTELSATQPQAAIAKLEYGEAMVLVQSFVALEAADTPKGSVVPMSEECPEDGWRHYRSDGKRLYFPFGLMVDADGEPHMTPSVLLPACQKL